MIIAGPGSGKTEVLARRVAHFILTGDVSPEKMIVTTFTKKAAWELKDRIQKWLPDENVELMQVSTFHSLCGELLRRYSLGPDAEDFRILEEDDQLLFVYANRHALGLDELVKYRPQKFFRSVIRAFNLATEEMVDVERLLEWCQNGACGCSLVETDLWGERRIITEAYEVYLELLNEQRLLDFALSQRKALDLLENKDSLAKIRDRYEEILVDEYQDTDTIQFKLMDLLARDGKHLTVVGDDDQSIYRFRGATVKNITKFYEHFVGARSVKLEDNFRSLPPIVENSMQVIANNPARIHKDLKAVREGTIDLHLVYRRNASEEAKSIVDLLKHYKQAGKIARYDDVAILLRSVKTSGRGYASALLSAGIPFQIIGDDSYFRRPEINALFNLFIFLGASKSWGDAYLRSPLVGLESKTRLVLQDYKEDLIGISSIKELQSIGIDEESDRKKLRDILDLKRQVQTEEHSSLLDVFYQILAITGCVTRFENEENYEAILNLGAMSSIAASWDEFGKTRKLHSFNEYLKLLKDGGKDPSQVAPDEAVKIMTIHQSKGLEFPVVVIGSATNGKLPLNRHDDPYDIPYNLRAGGIPEVEDRDLLHLMDERKLFYVAATRARDLLIVGTTDVDCKKGDGPSLFVKEMFGEDLQRAADLSKSRIDEIMSHKKGHAGPRPRHSFSQLVYFLQCPIRYKLAVVYGFQMPWLDHVGFGANVHRALEAIHNRAIVKQVPAEEDIASIVSENWISKYGTKPEKEMEFKDAATKQLKRYLNEHGDRLSETLNAETPFSFFLDDQVMLGKIDLLRRGDSNGTEIVDFKTSIAEPIEKDGIDLQLDLYALGIEECLGRKVAKTTVHFLGDGKMFTSLWSNKRKKAACSRLGEVLGHIKNHEFNPSSSYCNRCKEFRNICPYFSQLDERKVLQ